LVAVVKLGELVVRDPVVRPQRAASSSGEGVAR
jgi:hypothetical protein